MRLYIVSTDDNGYDEYDSVAVFAENEKEADKLSRNFLLDEYKVEIKEVDLNKIEKGVVHSSFNAG